jgi:hypothetical protein
MYWPILSFDVRGHSDLDLFTQKGYKKSVRLIKVNLHTKFEVPNSMHFHLITNFMLLYYRSYSGLDL